MQYMHYNLIWFPGLVDAEHYCLCLWPQLDIGFPFFSPMLSRETLVYIKVTSLHGVMDHNTQQLLGRQQAEK